MSAYFPIIEVPTDAARAEEAMGSKSKFWHKDTNLGDCLFKRSRPNTGEDWSEKVAAELCHLLGLPHATYELAIWNGQLGIISPYFLPDKTDLVHGDRHHENWGFIVPLPGGIPRLAPMTMPPVWAESC